MSRLDSLIEVALLREDATLLQFTDDAEDHSFSPDFEKKWDTMFTSPPRKTRHLARRALALVAVAALLICSVSAYAFWDQILALLVKVFPQYAEYRMSASVIPREAFHDFPPSWTEIWVPEYMTDGYTYFKCDEKMSAKRLIFMSGSSEIVFDQYKNKSQLFGDSEGDMVSSVSIGGQPANTFQKQVDGSIWSRVAWSINNYYFIISGPVSLDDLVKIGEAIVLCEIGEK